MCKENDLELVHVKSFHSLNEENIGEIFPFRNLAEHLVRFIGDASLEVLLLEIIILSRWRWNHTCSCFLFQIAHVNNIMADVITLPITIQISMYSFNFETNYINLEEKIDFRYSDWKIFFIL